LVNLGCTRILVATNGAYCNVKEYFSTALTTTELEASQMKSTTREVL